MSRSLPKWFDFSLDNVMTKLKAFGMCEDLSYAGLGDKTHRITESVSLSSVPVRKK